MGGRVYVQNTAGKAETLQERVVCLDADTGKPVWEHRFNVFLSDVPPHRVGWASPVADPATGNVYAFGVGGTLLALSRDGKLLWERALAEEYGLVTTHGGRTVSPVIEGDLVVVSGVTSGWGSEARAGHRFLAFDKASGETAWIASPGGRPYDTTYSPAVAGVVNGTRLLIAGGSDGAVHALKPQTGETVWRFEMSKRGINTGALLNGNEAIVSHSEENLDTSEMGMLAAVDATATGELGKDRVRWIVKGFQGGYSSPVLDGQRLYQIDNGSNLFAFDVGSGRQLWTKSLGSVQKASPVLADGKLYVGAEGGRFFILKPGPQGAEVLDDDLLGPEQSPETIVASVAVADGRVYLASMETLYCIGSRAAARPRQATRAAAKTAANGAAAAERAPAGAQPAHLQVRPADVLLAPGQRSRFSVRLYDAQGRFIREEPSPAWSLEKLDAAIEPSGELVASAPKAQSGLVKAGAAGLTGSARVRVVPPLPWSLDFDALEAPPPHWVNATGKFAVRPAQGSLGSAGKVLLKLADNAATKRARVFMGGVGAADYTVRADVLAREQRRQMGDAGVVAQRYALVLFGNHQRLELQPWQPETARTASTEFAWKPDVWYRLKLRVQNEPDGRVRAMGKAWPAAEPEPAAWTIERVDPIPNRRGSPGLYADAPAEVYFDNLEVTANR
jgi:outer membrane protein assembly factor BamB